jgi:hypothetical protein
VSRCRSCGAEIRWARMSSGRAMPLDLEPSPAGTVALVDDEHAETLSRDAAELEREAGRELYVSHFATCPNSAQHRRR